MSSRGPRMEGTKTKDISFLGDKVELLILLSPVKTGNKDRKDTHGQVSMKKGFKLKHYVIVFSTSQIQDRWILRFKKKGPIQIRNQYKFVQKIIPARYSRLLRKLEENACRLTARIIRKKIL
jgi:hypothetical protein